jgi:N-acetylglucosaminyl-diphospho-decaprenol L-rhamnosyltransferase
MKNILTKKNITFVITTFKSRSTIFDCLDSLNPDCKKIIIENSNDENLMLEIKKKYQNLNYKIMPSNYGYGKANNFGIRMSNTDYIFILNPDAKFEKNSFDKFINILIDKDFCIAAPTDLNEAKKIDFKENDLINVDTVKGFAMLLKKSSFENFFDENFFLYLEEIDLCLRITKNKGNIFLVNAPVIHLGGASHGDRSDIEMEKSRNWHWMWSKFYFNKKHYGYFFAIYKTLPNFINSIFKYIYYNLLNKKDKKEISRMRVLGLLNSYMLKKSSYRPYL